jgi:serine-type D-Ala-D-Ala carboxypeptidase/endopeptidase
MIEKLMKPFYLFLLLSLGNLDGVAQSSKTPLAPDSEIQKIIAERVKGLSAGEGGVGIVVGIVDANGQRLLSSGHLNQKDTRTLDGNTVFEIASVTKIFTGLLLADMIQKKEVALTDPVSGYLPTVKLPLRNDGKAITLLDLVTHTAGLQFMPSAKINSREDLYQYLAGYVAPVERQWDYSNVGYWLLSEALASKAGVSYEKALQERVIDPLKLTSTSFTLTADMKKNLAIGHDGNLQASKAISSLPGYSLMPAAGGLYSTANDLMKLLSAALNYEDSPLGVAISISVSYSRPISKTTKRQALGWIQLDEKNGLLIYHDGGSMGFASCIMFDPVRRAGVVVLSNQVTGVTDLAHHLLRPDFRLEHPKVLKHKEIHLDAAKLDRYVGKFEADGEGIFVIVRNGNHLLFEAPSEWGLPVLRIRPESVSDFFATDLPLRVTFQRNEKGSITGILIYPPRGQKALPARRVK